MHRILGIDVHEEDLYRFLVASGPVSPADHELDGRGDVLDRLRDKGMVYGDDLVYAADPQLALQVPMLEHRQDLARAERKLAELQSLFRDNTRLRRKDNPVDVMDDLDLVRQSFTRLHDLAEEEVLSFLTVPYRVVANPDGIDNPHSARCRIIAEKEVFQDPVALEGLRYSQAAGCDIRMIDRLPHKLLISDRRQAMVPHIAGESVPVLTVQPGTLMDALVEVFETYWRQALPVSSAWRNNGSDKGRPTEQEITVLRHLTRGATEGAIATTLGISKRTVIRRVQSLMDRAGVDTRLQLGVYAVRNGWLGALLD
ncbi:LuxR C-terminal-related transcriptional regulator [Nonomuraea angiospora]